MLKLPQIVVCILLLTEIYAEYRPPGVAPHQYTTVQPQVQYNHPPVVQAVPGVPPKQYQEPVVQYQQQQPPVQPQIQPQQQVNKEIHQEVHQQHQYAQPQQVLNANVEHEREHIQEHIQVPVDTSKMSEAELQFHYFKMHDTDNNNKLDGCELIKSLIHWHVDGKTNEKKEDGINHKIYTDQELTDVIDYVLKTMDFNNDGYVDYAEYRKSEATTEANKDKN